MAATVYYVDGTGGDGLSGDGKDTNTGTSPATPFLTLAKANAVVKAGDTVMIRGGTYVGQIKPASSGTVSAQITYTRYKNESVNIVGLDETTHRAWEATPIDVGPRSYIVIDNLDFRLARKRLVGAVVFLHGSNNVLRNSRVINADPNTREGQRVPLAGRVPVTFGLSIRGSVGNVLEGNTISGWWNGLNADYAKQATVRRNVIAGNTHNQIKISGGGEILGQLYEENIIGGSITSDGLQTDFDNEVAINIRGVVIRNNHIYFNGENAFDPKSGGDMVFEGNVVVGSQGDNDGTGVYRTSTGGVGGANRGVGTFSGGTKRSSQRIIVRHNTFYDNSGGINIWGADWKLYNNTFVANNRDTDGPNTSFDAAAEDSPNWWENSAYYVGAAWKGKSGTSFVNNIVVDHKDAALRKLDTGATTLEINNNLYYDGGNSVLFYRGNSKIQNLTRLNFAQWQRFLASESGNIGADANSIVADPSFVNVPGKPDFPFFNFKQPDVANPVFMKALTRADLPTWFPYNFSLQSNSPAIDAGKTLTRATTAGTDSKSLKVTDASFFFDGYGIAGEGDVIQIGSERPVKVASINYASQVITLEAARTWANGAPVSLPYSGAAPDIGAFEFTGTSSNTPPVAVQDRIVTAQNEAVTIQVLRNDSDADEGDVLSVSAITQADQGTVTNNVRDITYTPNSDFTGEDRFTYTVSDGNGGEDTATVTVTVSASSGQVITLEAVADAHVRSGSFSQSNYALSEQLLVRNSSGDWGRESFLTFDLSNLAGTVIAAKLIMEVVKDDDNATVVSHVAGVVDNAAWAENELTWDTKPSTRSPLNQLDIPGLGTYAFDVTTAVQSALGGPLSFSVAAQNNVPTSIGYASKEHADSTSRPRLQITYAAVNQTPKANTDDAQTRQDQALSIDVLANDSDADPSDVLSISAFTQGNNGTVTHSSGVLTYTPKPGFRWSDRFTYTISDGNGGSDTATVNVIVNAAPPAPVTLDPIVRVIKRTHPVTNDRSDRDTQPSESIDT